jgi:hypothetical protein
VKNFIVVTAFIFSVFASRAQNLDLASAKTNNAMTSPVFLKANAYESGYSEGFTPPGFNQLKAGRKLTLLGAFFILGGGIVYNAGTRSSTYDPYTHSNIIDPKIGLGRVMMATGVGLTVPGIILWVNGSKKYNSYVESEKATTSIQFKGNGLSLNYHF